MTGGIGAGKSEALKAFARRDVPTVSSDEIVHRLLAEDEEVRSALVERLGPEVMWSDGVVDRRKVAELVFADRAKLAWLEQLLHPRVAAEYLRWRDELAALPEPPAVCVTEVPLLYEVGGESRFDAVVAITAPPGVRAGRTRVEGAEERAQRLIPDEEKVRRADFAYVNDGTLEELDAFVGDVLEQLEARR